MGSKPHRRPLALRVALGTLALLAPPDVAAAQGEAGGAPMTLGTFVGSDGERYLRVLQTLGLVQPYPWSIRGFSPQELHRLRPLSDTHPWARYAAFGDPGDSAGPQKGLLAAELISRYNSTFPYGTNDGALWVGRGLTVAAQGGAGVRHGPMSVIVAPMVFWAQNGAFPTLSTGLAGNLQYVDPMFLLTVDRPQRFGDDAYARVDFGQSTARVDYYGAFGISTANQWWGPMTEFPFLIGNNAPGFTHLFLGTASPANVWIGRVHFRVMYGALSQSAYTDITGRDRRRLATGAVALFTPRGLPGLELGAARFFHSVWPDSGVGSRELRRPFESLLKLALPRDPRDPEGSENQLASMFFRWVVPRSGFEVYGEYGRDDHSGDARDLLQEPDHSSAYGLGLQKAWRQASGSIVVVGGEVANFEISHLVRHRQQGGIYAHNTIRQGHTNRGQLLGTGYLLGSGSASALRVERYTTRGSQSLALIRAVVLENENPSPGTSRCVETCLDVQYALRASQVRRRDRLEARYGLTAVYELNRYMGGDAFNLRPEVDLRWYP